MFLVSPAEDDKVRAIYDAGRKEEGYVSNYQRAWAWRPDVSAQFAAARQTLIDQTALTLRERAILTCATVHERRDSYCALAWGSQLAKTSNEAIAAELLATGDSRAMTPRDRALAAWARKVATAPVTTTPDDIANLRKAGLSDADIFDATISVAFRLAFCTVNDALGVQPDLQVANEAPAAVRSAIDYGRPVASSPSR
jgi:uncharacterized peroxidase-related enzyme